MNNTNGFGFHSSVMLTEALEALAVRPDGFYVDCTFGRGGHSVAILLQLGKSGHLLAMDKDVAALESMEAKALLEDSRFALVHGSFTGLRQQAQRLGMDGKVDGVLMDLGVSSPQLDQAERGFSFLRDGPLDMRMDASQGQTAAEWLAEIVEKELAWVLKTYGEERFARRIAQAIVKARPIASTRQLAALIEKVVPLREKHKHPATRSFQAIRIAVNRELDELNEGLKETLEVLAPGGRLAVISFHSLEDRIVKHFMREQERGKPTPSRLPVLNAHQPTLKTVGKAKKPSAEELQENARARSAVLRIAERVAA
jgi:16S rRNA (cytosine1402-N4)-methyltransferase